MRTLTTTMKRSLWGRLIDERQNGIDQLISVPAKQSKLEESDRLTKQTPLEKSTVVKIKNPFVTQTVEVMKQTEMLKSLIDTYSTKSGPTNYLLNPCQMIPEVDFPPENAVEFSYDGKYSKPLWFIPLLNTRFSKRSPLHYTEVGSEASKSSLRKAITGQLRVTGFTDSAHSAIILFSDAVEEFLKNLMQHVHEVNMESRELNSRPYITIKTIEKAFFLFRNTSLIQVHNYWRNLLSRNCLEISEYKSVFQEYDKLMKASRNMQKEECHEGIHLCSTNSSFECKECVLESCE